MTKKMFCNIEIPLPKREETDELQTLTIEDAECEVEFEVYPELRETRVDPKEPAYALVTKVIYPDGTDVMQFVDCVNLEETLSEKAPEYLLDLQIEADEAKYDAKKYRETGS